jgi:hypothetical protein
VDFTGTTDRVHWSAQLTVEKFDAEQTARAIALTGKEAPSAADFEALGIVPAEVMELPRNLITTNGLGRLANLLIGSGQAASATAARIGVGDGSGTAAAGDVDLSASSGSAHRWFQVMDSTYPSVSGAVATFKATFAAGDGNFAWNEWCIDIGTPTVASANTVNALMLNHKTGASLGTKTSGISWVATATITFS